MEVFDQVKVKKFWDEFMALGEQGRLVYMSEMDKYDKLGIEYELRKAYKKRQYISTKRGMLLDQQDTRELDERYTVEMRELNEEYCRDKSRMEEEDLKFDQEIVELLEYF